MWAFQSWSDGGELNHAYKVASTNEPASLTAKYIPAGLVTILTQPVGLKIKVDGQYNVLNSNYFAWGIGETHHLDAPAQQTDAQGRVWQFSSWSNGGKAIQDIVVPDDSEMNGMRLTATYTPLTKVTVNSSLAGLSLKLDGVACTTPVRGAARSGDAGTSERAAFGFTGRWIACGLRRLAGNFRRHGNDSGGQPRLH